MNPFPSTRCRVVRATYPSNLLPSAFLLGLGRGGAAQRRRLRTVHADVVELVDTLS